MNKSFLLLLFLAASREAAAFPEMIRHGYPACGACHVSPAGGGALTAYGRSNAGDLMSTFTYKDGENPLYGLLTPPAWMSFGGDTRYVNYTVKTKDFEFTRMFLMQRDFELALHLSDTITIGGSYGLYGELQRAEQRRSYVIVQFAEGVRARVGRFIPTYGTLQADHTLAVRSGLGLGQGDETYNAELSWSGKRGEIFVTGIGGRSLHLSMGDADGYETRSDDFSGGMVSASLFLGKRARIGVSGAALSSADQAKVLTGAHLLWGFTGKLYLMAEYSQQRLDEEQTEVHFGKLGWEIFRGIHVAAIADGQTGKQSTGWQVQLFPLVHWEILAQLTRTVTAQGTSSTSLLLFHTYL